MSTSIASLASSILPVALFTSLLCILYQVVHVVGRILLRTASLAVLTLCAHPSYSDAVGLCYSRTQRSRLCLSGQMG